MSPHLDTGAKDLADVVGAEPSGRYRMSLAAISDTPATIIATLVEQRGYWHGIPVLWIILMLGAAYIGLNVALQRRRYPPSPIVTVQRRDSV